MIISIDPGATGAIAFRDDEGRVGVENMPETIRDLIDLLHDLLPVHWQGAVCVMEDVGKSQGREGRNSAATFARQVGRCETAAIAAGYVLERVTPQKWMQALVPARPKGRDNVKERKDYIYARVQELCPCAKITKRNADAVGILLAWERLHATTLCARRERKSE